MNPNHYLSVAISYLFSHRPAWSPTAGVGKTVVSSSMIDRVAARLGRPLVEVPVGFKWFVDGLVDGTLGFAGEESAGASFVRRDGTVWSTDKDGIILGLLAAEMTAVTGSDPGDAVSRSRRRSGSICFTIASTRRRIAAGTGGFGAAIAPTDVPATELAGDRIVRMLTTAGGQRHRWSQSHDGERLVRGAAVGD